MAIDKEARSEKTQGRMEARSRKGDETVVDKGVRLKDRSSTVAFHKPLGDEELEDVGGSLDSILERLEGAFRRLRSCRYCRQEGHCPSKCPERPCQYCRKGKHGKEECPKLLEARERARRKWEQLLNNSEEEGDESDEECVVEESTEVDDPIGEGAPQGQGEGVVDGTLEDGAEQEDLEDSKGGEGTEIEGEASKEEAGDVNIAVQEVSQLSLQFVKPLYARGMEVVHDGMTLEELGVKLPQKWVHHRKRKATTCRGGTRIQGCCPRGGHKKPTVTGVTRERTAWKADAFVARGRGPKKRWKCRHTTTRTLSELSGGECHGPHCLLDI